MRPAPLPLPAPLPSSWPARLRQRRLPAALLTTVAALVAVLAAGLAHPTPAAAHDATSTAYVDVEGTGARVEATLDLEYDLLMKSAWLYAEAYEAKDRAE
ncbi:hypothetical protein [Streptomyces sp. NBC_00057]|uniref:hypothetical protein n=1 Tax=Streptomyces sp. NBC_00057 TaxID=2975634 RepID=UPI00324E6F5B